MAKIGRYEVPEDWPVTGEAGGSFAEKLKNGFFSTYMAGEVTIDVGYRGACEDAVPILPHAIGVDLDYPAYDGKKLPFPDESVDTVYSSHMLEHVADFRTTIRDWHRVVRSRGFIVCVVPHQFLYEKRRSLPSSWNTDHKRFYTPSSLLREFETSLRPNTYRVRHLRDSDENYTYEIGPDTHLGGGYEIEIVVQNIAPPAWDLAGPPDPFQDYLERALDEVSRLTAERDALSRESARWFDAAIVASAELVLRTPPPSRGRGWRRLARSLQAAFRRPNWEAIKRADRALDSGKWERAARLYLDGLSTTPDASDLWLQLGQALEATGKHAEATFAVSEAERRAMRRRGRKTGPQFQRLFRRLEGATADAGRPPDIRNHQPSQNPPPAATMLPELEKLQHLQTAPADENPGIEAGRNISAGYLRGTGLQYGSLVPSIEQDPD